MTKVLAGDLIITVGLMTWGVVTGHPGHSSTSVGPTATRTTASVPASDTARFRPVLQGPVMTCLRLLPRVQAEARTLQDNLDKTNGSPDTGTLLDDARTLGHTCVGAETRVLALRFPRGRAHDLTRRAQRVLAHALWSMTLGGDYAVAAVELTEQDIDWSAQQQIVQGIEAFQTAHAELSTARALLHF
jgi:hypothetical protein